MADKNTTNANAYLAFDTDANQVPNLLKQSFLPLYYDSSRFVSTGLVTSGSARTGEALVSVAGNVTSTFPIGTIISFANVAGTALYTVNSVVFESTVTNIGFTPSLATDIATNVLIYKVTPAETRFTELAVTNTMTGAVTNNALTIGVDPSYVDGIIAAEIGTADTLTYVNFTNTGGQVSSFNNSTGTFVVPPASQAAVIAALLALANGISQNTTGAWVLPNYPIYVGFAVRPGLTQFGIVSSITYLLNTNQLSFTISNTANYPFFNTATYPANLFIALHKFTFVPAVESEVSRLVSVDAYGFRDDITYSCVDSSGVNTFVGVPLDSDSQFANLILTSAINFNSFINNIQLSFLGAVPASFVNNTPIVVFSRDNSFNITVATLLVNGTNYTLRGEINGAFGVSIPSGSYGVRVCRAIALQTLQNLVGNTTLTSSDNSVQIVTTGQNINLRAGFSSGGGAGQATASNVGDYIDNAINEYIQPGGQPTNLGYIQIGTISAFTNNTRIINPTTTPPTGGYTFYNGSAQVNVASVVAELGPQRQLFRATVTGSWSLVPANYSLYRQSVGGGFILAPVFMRSGGDWQATTSDLFPGFAGSTSVGLLAPVTPVVPTPFRGGVSGGPRWTQQVFQVGSISTAFAGSQVNQTAVRITLANSATVSVFRGQEVTVPLKNLLSNDYIATEFLVDANASNSNTIDLILPTGVPAGTGFDQNLAIFTDRNLYVWTSGFPPLNTTFSGNAFIEGWLDANVWVASTTAQFPNGFGLPASTPPGTQYNLTWTVEVPDGANLTGLMYKMFSEEADSWMAPNAATQWNNSITVNSGGSTETVRWGDYVTSCRYNSAQTPVTNVSATFTTPAATVVGTVHYYNQYSSAGVAGPVFRFVPNTDSGLTSFSYDSFWRSFNSNTLTGLIIQRGQL